MPETRDLLIQHEADGDNDLSRAKIVRNVEIPLSKVDIAALGLSLGVSLRASVLGAASTFTVATTSPEAPEMPTDGTATVTINVDAISSLAAPVALFPSSVLGAGFTIPAAPAGATTYRPQDHYAEYFWALDGAPLAAPKFPLNMPEAWKDRNRAAGPRPIIVIDEPGQHTLSVLAVDEAGNYGRATYQVTVGEPDAAYPGGQTICVSEGGDFSGAPSGSTQVDLAGLPAALSALTGSDVRVLFRAGEDYRTAITSQIGLSMLWGQNTQIGRFGAGADPIFPLFKAKAAATQALFDVPRDSGEVKFVNLDMRGAWDPTTETGVRGQSPAWRDKIASLLFHGCSVSGCEKVSTPARAGDCWWVWSNGRITDWADMGIFRYDDTSGFKRVGITASAVTQNPASLEGRVGDKWMSQTHGAFRDERSADTRLGIVDLFSRGGWTGGRGGTATQPCWRINSFGAAASQVNRTTPTNNRGARPGGSTDALVNSDRVSMEGGYQVLKMWHQNTYDIDVPGNAVFTNTLIMASTDTIWLIRGSQGGATFRGLFGFVPSTPILQDGFAQLIEFDDPPVPQAHQQDVQQPENIAAPLRFLNSTLVCLPTTAQLRAGDAGAVENITGIRTADFLNVEIANLVEHYPNQNTPVTAPAVDMQAELGVTLRNRGTRHSLQYTTVTGDGSASITIPFSQLNVWPGETSNQAYWTARLAVPTNDWMCQPRHNTFELLSSVSGEVSVSVSSAGVTLTRTSGVFADGVAVFVKPGQADNQPGPDDTYSTAGVEVPLPRLLVADAASGPVPQTDFLGNPRRGSVFTNAPSGAPMKGAFEAV